MKATCKILMVVLGCFFPIYTIITGVVFAILTILFLPLIYIITDEMYSLLDTWSLENNRYITLLKYLADKAS